VSDPVFKVRVRHYPKDWDDTGRWKDAQIVLNAPDLEAAGREAVEHALGTSFFGADPGRVMWVSIAPIELPILIG
jgi:hypothetical protein